MKYIGLFCSASDLDLKYTQPAKQLAKLLAQHCYTLVYGASDRGLMKVMADEMQAGGSKLIGVTMPYYEHRARTTLDEKHVMPTLGERKAKILATSDVIIVLVGGIGTFDELTEVIELRKQDAHQKPIIVLNTENFYEGLKVQLQKMKDDGFFIEPVDQYVFFADTPEEVIEHLNKTSR